MASAIRWGILSTGKISHDFVTAVRSLAPEENQKVTAVAARQLEKAQEFAKCHNIEKAYGSYPELIADGDIDVVYVGSVNPTHYELVKQLLEAGRAVLCEKPLCINVRQTQELVALARERDTFLMEAVWTRCFPSVRRMMEELKTGTIGEVKHIAATFGIYTPENNRVRTKATGGGTALDLGVYCAQLTNLVMDNQSWSRLRTLGHLNNEGCDLSLSTSVTYPGRELATLVTHCEVAMECAAVITGTKGIMKLLPPFHAPTELVLPSGTVSYPVPPSFPGAQYNFENSAGLQYEALHVAECLRKGLKESPLMSLYDTIRTAEMVEAMRKSAGVEYPEDDFHFDSSTPSFNQDCCM
ncbi:trans-1,2-dihydrobenzene-1,2-diol dehydrogenase-like isoform X3 [Amphibalanus amphitrite]|nr:trans-1,2-dihydrobenzene-1,2-diol dehydrogenase-like isoform X3 [Amphibalanus amphitrite]XP_043216645.1 trans-1,2-dihydrobenzene-1,2-diol dehydrogenase-like isoform X3 [Amphibalanus amphitrite]XP_043216646.1 trans-1,2-dihydrobenzene-1,2-diol dehydrogenase-like isoform X3 [Amphibalanus amphitrite]XP_043216647.1 trans-1,2-dihydrobenzene-1,2-diol dehydrogenase-like isoform X3 [Amphibalanus amphitrite]XP_043216648.1 trans-1,2-dihydrobenzene-1,2-diol dehydrogenase-like isoform X3 [Amphibalanus am